MSECCSPQGYRTIFSESAARGELRRYRRRGLDRLSKRILDALRAAGVEGLSVLEVGGGIGALQVELLRAGAGRATNVELTPTYEGAAQELLRESGMAGRVERRSGDFVESGADVADADVVVLNRVICCYPDMPALVAAAAGHARRIAVLTFPNGRWWVRAGLALANLGFLAFRVRFHVFTHDPGRILAEAEKSGLRARSTHRGLVWQTAVLARPPA